MLTDFADSITVKLIDRFGRESLNTIAVNYFGTPSVKITNIMNDYDTNVSFITLSGTTKESDIGDSIEIFVNNIRQSIYELSAYDGNWSGSALLTNVGDSVMIKYLDQFGRTSYDTITINYYKAIDLSITYPVQSGTSCDTLLEFITIKGATKESGFGDTIGIYVSGVLQSVTVISSTSGSFSGTAKLSNQSDSVSAILYDRFNRTDSAAINVNYFDVICVKITYPNDNIDTCNKIITISGTTKNININDYIEIYVNSKLSSKINLSGLDANWSGTVSLTDINDTIVVKLYDKFGRISNDTIAANYYEKVSLSIDCPADNTCTNVSAIKLSGSTLKTFIGDSVVLNVKNSFGIVTYTQTISLLTPYGSYIFNNVNLSKGLNLIQVSLISKFIGLTDMKQLTIKYSDTVSVGISSPIATNKNPIDTNSIFVVISGTSTATVNNPIIVHINDRIETYPSKTTTTGDWKIDILLNNASDSKIANLIWVELIDEYTNRAVSDTITILCDKDNPPSLDMDKVNKSINATGDSPIILLKWDRPNMVNTVFGDDIKNYNIYRSDSININPIKVGNSTTERFIDLTGSYYTDYNYYVEVVDKASNISDSVIKFVPEIYPVNMIPLIKIWSENDTNPQYLNITVNLLKNNGLTILSFAGETMQIACADPKISFVSNTTTIVLDKVIFKVIKSSILLKNSLKLSVTFQNKTFNAVLYLINDFDNKAPYMFVSETYKKSYAMILVPQTTYNSYFESLNATQFILQTQRFFNNTEIDVVQKADNFVSQNFKGIKTLSQLTNNALILTKSIKLVNKSGEEVFNDKLEKIYRGVKLYISYPDEDNNGRGDGFIDGTGVMGFRGMPAASLRFYWLDDSNKDNPKWTMIPYDNNPENMLNKVISAPLNHFSIYSVFGPALPDTSGQNTVTVHDMIVYPNPFKPNSGLGHENVKFDYVKPGSTLRIFTVTGQLVSEAVLGPNDNAFIWDGKNMYGKPVASGVYIYMLQNGSEKKIDKILVIR